MSSINRPMYKRLPTNSVDRGSKGADLKRDIAFDYRRTVGIWLRDLRQSRELTQQDVADQLGLGFTAVSAIEVGRSSVPPEKYEELADLYEVDHKEFAKKMLRYSNPWAFAMIFGADKQLSSDISEIPVRNNGRRRRH